MALEARGFTRPGRRTLLWQPPDSGRQAVAAGCCSPAAALIIVARRWAGCRGWADGRSLMLALESVSYRYAGAARPSLHDVSLTCPTAKWSAWPARRRRARRRSAWWRAGLAPRTVGGTLTGRVLLDGEDAAPLAMHQLAGRIGIAFASPATQLSGVADTVYEEVAFGPMNLGLPRDEVIRRTEEALAALRIESLAPRDPARLSGGQQQLVAIAGLLALRPAHLVLDEPTAQLDPAGTGWSPTPWPAWPAAAPRS